MFPRGERRDRECCRSESGKTLTLSEFAYRGRTCAPCVEVDVQMRESERAWHISKTADLTEVLTAWRKVSGLDPNDGVALNNVGVLLYHLGRTAEAVVVLERAVDLRPRQGLVLANLAWVSYADGGRGVEEMFGRASRRSPWLLPFGIGRLSPEALKTRSVPSGHLGPSDSPNRNLMALSQAIGLGPIALRDPSKKRGAEAMRLLISHFVREETTPHSSHCRAQCTLFGVQGESSKELILRYSRKDIFL